MHLLKCSPSCPFKIFLFSIIALHFSMWKHKSHLSDHSCSVCISACSSSQSECRNIPLNGFASFANK